MCDACMNSEFVCSECGYIIDPEYEDKIPYRVARRELKNLVWTSQSETFVWILVFENKMVKVGCGGLIKLLNETRPNANYIRFDHVLIYWCADIAERDSFACRLIGSIDGLVNRRGIRNEVYKTKKELRWKTGVSASIRDTILGDADFKILDVEYFDVRKLEQYGVS